MAVRSPSNLTAARPEPAALPPAVLRALERVACGERLTEAERAIVAANFDSLAPDLRGASAERRAQRLDTLTGGPLPPVRVRPEEVPPELADNGLIHFWVTMSAAEERSLAEAQEDGRREYVAGIAGIDFEAIDARRLALP